MPDDLRSLDERQQYDWDEFWGRQADDFGLFLRATDDTIKRKGLYMIVRSAYFAGRADGATALQDVFDVLGND